MKFKVGDRVNNVEFGDGTIIGIKEDGAKYLVEFDKEDIFLHDGNGVTAFYGTSQGKKNHCYWYCDSMITLIPKEEIRLQNGDEVTFKYENEEKILHMIIGNDWLTKMLINKTIKEFDNSGSKSITLKVERPTYNTIYERKEEILDDVEKKYLKEYIDKYLKNCSNITITKKFCNQSFINAYEIIFRYYNNIIKNNCYAFLPYFKDSRMYKNMKTNKEYTLDDLGLDK